MFGQTFYFGTIRKYVILFGTLFNDLLIIREEGDANDMQILKVPIQYAPKEKMLARIEGDPDIDRPFSVRLPRMSFEMTSFSYDGNRHLPTINRVVKKVEGDSNKLKYQYMPTCWNIRFNLYIYVNKQEDGAKIIEQILPFFTPTWTTTVNLIPEMDVNVDIPITILNMDLKDSYDDRSYKENRVIVWTLPFELKGYLWGPIKQTGIIKVANTTFYIANTQDILTEALQTVEVSVNTAANSTSLITLSSGNTKNLKVGWAVQTSSNSQVVNAQIRSQITSIVNSSAFVVNTDIVIANGSATLIVSRYEPGERVIISPGMDANGDPITYWGPRPANTATVPYSQIEEDDDWGFITEIESVPLGTPRPIGGNSTFSNTQIGDE